MGNISLKNEALEVEISLAGAALENLRGRRKQTKFICNHSETGLPTVLFPTLTAIKDGYILKDGQSYPLMHGGFAKLENFRLLDSGETFAVLGLSDNEETRKVFPYSFDLQIKYELEEDTLYVSTVVTNHGKEKLPFMLGFHPAYACSGETILSCEHPLTASRYIRKNLMVTDIEEKYFYGFTELALSEEFFAEGTIAMTDMSTKIFTLSNAESGQAVTVDASEFQNVAIFAPGNKPLEFVSIECWDGSPDWDDTDHVWETKRDMTILQPGMSVTREFSIRCKEADKE